MSKLKNFKVVPESQWPEKPEGLKKVFLSTQYMVQVYEEDNGISRLSICCVKRKGAKWVDGITWDTLQDIKNKIGFSNKCAVEVYPEASNLVNVANMRHLFVLPERPGFAWSKN